MQMMSEKQAGMRLKLWLFRVNHGSWPLSVILTERGDFEPFFKNQGWGPVANWFNNPNDAFPEDAIRDLMEKVVYARG